MAKAKKSNRKKKKSGGVSVAVRKAAPKAKKTPQVSIGKDPKRVYSCGRIWDAKLGKLVYPTNKKHLQK